MNDLINLFDKETVENISNMIESKMFILNNVKDFHKKDQLFAVAIEKLENTLSDELSNQLDDIMRLNYQIESYYLTLAYFLGIQHGKLSTNL